MLASILPGLREVRTPLTVGYMWLLVIWLLSADRWPTERPTSGVLHDLWRIGETATAAAILSVVSFVAYLLGSMVAVDVQSGFARPLARLSARSRGTREVLDRVERRWRQQIEAAFANGWRSEVKSPLDLLVEIREDSRVLSTALLTKDEQSARLFDQYDRIQAEADLRINLVLPVAVVFGVLSGRAHWAFAAGVLVALLLGYQGLLRLRRAEDVLLIAIASEVVDTEGTAALRRMATEEATDAVGTSRYHTDHGSLRRTPDGTITLPDGRVMPQGSRLLTGEVQREDRSFLQDGTIWLPGGALLPPPWKEEVIAGSLLLPRGRVLRPDGTEVPVTHAEEFQAKLESEGPGSSLVRWKLLHSTGDTYLLQNTGDGTAQAVALDAAGDLVVKAPRPRDVSPGEAVQFMAVVSFGTTDTTVEVKWTEPGSSEVRTWSHPLPPKG